MSQGNIVTVDIPEKSECRILQTDQSVPLGWRVAALMQDRCWQVIQERDPTDPNNYRTVPVSRDVTMTRLLIFRDEESGIEEAVHKQYAAERAAFQLEIDLSTAKRAHEDEEKKQLAKIATLERTIEGLRRTADELPGARETARKLERDIGEIRKQIGAQKMKEILGA